jgi:hypothetical protein
LRCGKAAIALSTVDMNHFGYPRTSRRLIACLLVSSLSVASFAAPVLAAPATASANQESTNQALGPAAPHKCCCGTPDGRCCGMGCCMKQAPKPAPAETPARPSQSDHEQLVLSLAAASVVIATGCHLWSAGEFILSDDATSVFTLQSQHVRIQT